MRYKLSEVWARNVLEVCTAVQLAYNEVNWLNKISVAEQFVLEVEMFNCIGNNMHIYHYT